LGVFQSSVDSFGNQVFTQNLVERIALAKQPTSALEKLIGTAWDAEMDLFREDLERVQSRTRLAS
jgi:hypothetical protein